MIQPRQLIGILALLGTLSLTGCVGSSGSVAQPLGEETSAPSPVISSPQSREELLAEAVDVINNYYATVLQILSDPTIDASLLKPYGTVNAIDQARSDQDEMATDGERFVGERTISNALIQEVDTAQRNLTVLVCSEYGQVRLMRNGADVTPPDRPLRSTMRVTLTRENQTLLVERSVLWEGSTICS